MIGKRAKSAVCRAWVTRFPLRLAATLSIFVLFDLLLFRMFDRGDIFWSIYCAPMPPHGVFWYATPILFALLCRFLLPTIPRINPIWAVLFACGLALVCVMLIGSVVLESFPNSGDEYAYLFQSWTYQAGRLWNAPPPLGQFMAPNYTWVTPNRWAGQYNPGWPLLMLPAIMIGWPGWVVNLPLLAIAVRLLFDLLIRHTNRTVAALISILFLLSPFTLFNAASFFPHLFAATLVLAIYWAHDREIARPRLLWPLVIGIGLGVLGVTRTVSAVVAAAPLIIDLIRRKDRSLSRLCWIVVGGTPFLAGLMWYQSLLTGNALKPVYYLGGRTVDHLYFQPVAIEVGLLYTFGRLQELTLWGAPLIVPIWIASLFLKSARRTLLAPDFVFPAAVCLFIFYPAAGGNRYGPRYYFEFWPMMLFTVATAYHLFDAASRKIVDAFMVASAAYGIITSAFLARDYHEIVRQREDMYTRARYDVIGRAVICFESGAGLLLPLGPVDLARNGVDPVERILYVRCGDGVPAKVHDAYPDRQLLFYRWDSPMHHGVISLHPG